MINLFSHIPLAREKIVFICAEYTNQKLAGHILSENTSGIDAVTANYSFDRPSDLLLESYSILKKLGELILFGDTFFEPLVSECLILEERFYGLFESSKDLFEFRLEEAFNYSAQDVSFVAYGQRL